MPQTFPWSIITIPQTFPWSTITTPQTCPWSTYFLIKSVNKMDSVVPRCRSIPQTFLQVFFLLQWECEVRYSAKLYLGILKHFSLTLIASIILSIYRYNYKYEYGHVTVHRSFYFHVLLCYWLRLFTCNSVLLFLSHCCALSWPGRSL